MIINTLPARYCDACRHLTCVDYTDWYFDKQAENTGIVCGALTRQASS
jgi:hypothetical protein